MISFPNCKINIGLHITQRREDGYHNIDTVFYPITLNDALEFVESDEMKFTTSGLEIPGDASDNIILKAYELLKKDFPNLPNLYIHLHKNIPTGAGLGGGSSNAAAMLKILCEYFNLPLTPYPLRLVPYALVLGSDCPFFIYNKPCHAIGRGEVLTPISLDLSAYNFILIFPNIHINTAWAFTQISPSIPIKTTSEIVQQPLSTWKDELKNDFEEAVFKAHPQLKNIKENLYNIGALYCSMSGSGSTMYGIIEKNNLQNVKQRIEEEKLFEGMEVWYI